MKRRLTKLVLFLLLGAVVNVAVAWGFTAWVNPFKIVFFDADRRVRMSAHDMWELVEIVVPGMTLLQSTRSWVKQPRASSDQFRAGGAQEELIPSWSDLGEESDDFLNVVARASDSFVIERRWVHCFGWPTRSLWYHWYKFERSDSSPVTGGEGYIFPLERWSKQIPRALPYRPIWPGFAINTAFYAAILWLLTLGPFAARRMIRRKRGRCIRCGYDLRSEFSAGCPECGWRREDAS